VSRRSWIIIAVVVALAVAVLVAVLLVTRDVMVPDVSGKTQADATKVLEDAGLKAGAVTRQSNSTVAADLVIGQQPAAGAHADKGSAVALTVSSGPGTAAVPDVVGMTRADAESQLTTAGFVTASTMQYDQTAPAGEVVGQLPAGGEQAVTGSQVGLLVSKGKPDVSVSVPDVTGKTQDEATSTLSDAGLIAVPVEANSSDVPKGDVAAQDPAAGVLIAPLSEVLITVSLGPGTTSVTMPDVVGKAQADAVKELEAAGLTVTTAQAYSPDVKKGTVISQAPTAGTKVEKGGESGILVSLGPSPKPAASPTPSPTATPSASPTPSHPIAGPNPPQEPPAFIATVPDVVGKDAAQAEAELTKLGLRPVRLQAPSDTAPKGSVVSQLPPGGSKLPKTFPVLLLVSTGPAPQVTPLPAASATPSLLPASPVSPSASP